MKINLGYKDRTVRFVIGIILIAMVPAGHAWGLIGIVPILTATFAFCPAYTLFGINTSDDKCCGKCKDDKQEK